MPEWYKRAWNEAKAISEEIVVWFDEDYLQIVYTPASYFINTPMELDINVLGSVSPDGTVDY